MKKQNKMLNKILPLFLMLTIVVSMLGIDTLVAKANAVKAEGPVEILEVIKEGKSSDIQKILDDNVKVKVTLKNSDTKKLVKKDTSFAIYDKKDKDFEDVLGFIDVEEGKASEELALEPGTYVLQQFEEINGYKDVKNKTFEVKENQKKAIDIIVTVKPTTKKAASEPSSQDAKEGNPATTVSAEWIGADIKESFSVRLKNGETIAAVADLKDGQEKEPLTFKEEKDASYTLEVVEKETLEAKGYSVQVSGDVEHGFLVKVISSKKYTSINAKVEGLAEEVKEVALTLKNSKIEATAKAEAINKWETVFGADQLADAYIYNQETGEQITYEVTAPKVEGYQDPVVTGDEGKGFVVTYTAIPTERTINIRAEFKDTEDNILEGVETNVNIVFGEEVEVVPLEKQDGAWLGEITIPLDVEEYTIEPEELDGYLVEYFNEDDNPDQWDIIYTENVEEEPEDPVDPDPILPEDPTNPTNPTEDPEVDNTISVPVKIVWKNTNTAAKKEINLILKRRGSNTGYNTTVKSKEKWKSSFKKVDPEAAYEYELVYPTFEGYTAEKSGNIEDGFVITYTKDKKTTSTTKATTATKATTRSTTRATTESTIAKEAKTGDDNHLVMYIIVLCVAVAGFVVLRKRNRTR